MCIQSNCRSNSSSFLLCISPPTPYTTSIVDYVLRLDNAPSPNATALPLAVVPDPIINEFVPQSIPLNTMDNIPIILSFIVSTKDCELISVQLIMKCVIYYIIL